MKYLEISLVISIVAFLVWLRDLILYMKHLKKGNKLMGSVVDVYIGPEGACRPLVEYEFNNRKIVNRPISFIYDPVYRKNDRVEIFVIDNEENTFIIKNNIILIAETFYLVLILVACIVLAMQS